MFQQSEANETSNSTRQKNNSDNFDGLISEFPGLGLDKFNTKADIFLLTHCHSDHLIGLQNQSFGSIVYCSETTKKIIALDKRYRHVLSKIIPVPYNIPYKFNLNKNEVILTLIPAYHCPGASMFLIESEETAVLCTGDLRAENWWVQSLSRYPCLFPYTTGSKTLSNIYLDTTFSYRGEPYIEMPLNNDGIQNAVEFIRMYPLEDSDIQFYFTERTLGFEEAWAQISSFFKSKLHIDGNLKNIVKILDFEEQNYSNALRHSLADSEGDAKFHVVSVPSKNTAVSPKFPIKIKQCIDFNVMDFCGLFFPILLSSLSEHEKKEELKLIDTTSGGHHIYQFREKKWLLLKDSDELLPSEIKLVFSRHSSYSECRNLVSLFNPKQVHPCISSQLAWNGGFLISRLFGDLCANSQEPKMYAYDSRKMDEFGAPPMSIMNKPVKTIDRWDFEQCIGEFKFVTDFLQMNNLTKTEFLNSTLTERKFKFRGQHQISTFRSDNDSKKEKERRLKGSEELKLQRIILGRREEKFRDIIVKQQFLRRTNMIAPFESNFDNKDAYLKIGMSLGSQDYYRYSSEMESSSSENSPNRNDLKLLSEGRKYNSQMVNREVAMLDSFGRQPVSEINKNQEASLKFLKTQSHIANDIEGIEPSLSSEIRNPAKSNSNSLARHKVSINRKEKKKKRATLQRTNGLKQHSTSSLVTSLIESTFNSIELSIHRSIKSFNDDSCKKTNSEVFFSNSYLISKSKVFHKSRLSINKNNINKIASNLSKDPYLWFSLQLHSTDLN